MKPEHDAWDWSAIGAELEETCEHNSGITVFELGRFSITLCTWWCRGFVFHWKNRRGITKTLFVIRPPKENL